MDAAVIKFKASGQQLSVVSTNLFAANTVSYIRAEFELGHNWDGWDSVRAVWATDFAKIATVLDSDGSCTIPWEVLKRTATLYVNLVGSISDGDELTDRLTTYKVKALDVNGCTNVDGDNTQPITPSQFEQFVGIVAEDADRAETANTKAQGYAEDASEAKEQAQGFAEDAEGYKDSASESATQAGEYKDEAKGYAEDAEADAEEIRNMRATATTLPAGSSATANYSDGLLTLGIPKGDTGEQGETGNGIASAVLNADYTLTLNFTDGTHYTTPPIRGAQGVQGETGNGIDRIELTDTTGAVKTYTIYFTDGSTYDFEVTDGEVTLAELASVLPTDTASGAIASFEDGSDLFDYLSCIVNIEPVQAGSGTPSPDNVRPITGWTGCEVDVVGVNVWDEVWELGYINASTGGNSSSTTEIRSKNYIPVSPSTTYYAYTGNRTGTQRMAFYDSSKTYIGNGSGGWAVFPTNGTFTTPSNARYMRFYVQGHTYSNDISINYPPTDHDYHAYNGTTHPVSWQTEAGTVYGGTVDLVTGVLTVTHALLDMSGVAFSWSYDGVRWQSALSGLKNYPSRSDDLKFERYGVSTSASSSTEGVGFTVGGAIYIYTSNSTDAPSGNVWYPLATPTTYQLTGEQIDCLLGQNNVWADCGDIEEVKYKADVQLYIEKMLNA